MLLRGKYNHQFRGGIVPDVTQLGGGWLYATPGEAMQLPSSFDNDSRPFQGRIVAV